MLSAWMAAMGQISTCREGGRLICKGRLQSTWVAVQGAHHHLQESWHVQQEFILVRTEAALLGSRQQCFPPVPQVCGQHSAA